MRLIAELLHMQDPSKPHTLLTRILVSVIIVGISLVYTGFFGVLVAVGVYLLCVELLDMHLHWIFAPVILALLIGLQSSFGHLLDYWRNYGRG